MEGWIDPDEKRVRDRGARMENAGKPSGGRSEWSPLPSPLFCMSQSFSVFVFLLNFLPPSLSPPPLTLFLRHPLSVGAFAWMLVMFNLDNLQH